MSDMGSTKKILVAFFSATGRTRKLAQRISEMYNLELFEIKPKKPYTKLNLFWINPLSRVCREHRNKFKLPEIENNDMNLNRYDKVVICFPVWWFTTPNVIHTFLKTHDFSNKKVLLFGTSGSSGVNDVVNNLKDFVDSSCTIIEGKINPTDEEIKDVMDDFIG